MRNIFKKSAIGAIAIILSSSTPLKKIQISEQNLIDAANAQEIMCNGHYLDIKVNEIFNATVKIGYPAWSFESPESLKQSISKTPIYIGSPSHYIFPNGKNIMIVENFPIAPAKKCQHIMFQVR